MSSEAELVLAEAVERLAVVLAPLLPDVERLLALHLGGDERPPALLLDEDRLAPGVEERDLARAEVHADLHLRRGERRLAPGVGALDRHRPRSGARPRPGSGGRRRRCRGRRPRARRRRRRRRPSGGRRRPARTRPSAASGRPGRPGRTSRASQRRRQARARRGFRFIGVLQCERPGPSASDAGSRTPLGCGRPPWPGSRRRRRGRAARRGRSARRRGRRRPRSR